VKAGLRRAIAVILVFTAAFWVALRAFGGSELAHLLRPVMGITALIGWLLLRMGAAEQRLAAVQDTGARQP